MNWDWIVENWQAIFSFTTVAVAACAWLYARYWRRRDALQQDLERLLRDALDYLKVWAGDTLEEVTEGEVAEVADWFYSRYVSGSLLERLIGGAQFRAALWAMFTRWRDMFIGASYALVK